MKKCILVLTALIMCFLLCACSGNSAPAANDTVAPVIVETTPAVKQPSVIGDSSGVVITSENSWHNNVLSKSALDSFEIKRDKILTVTFLDSIADAPDVTWNLGEGATDSVLGWMEYDGKYAHIYIAANGGINGKISTEALFLDCYNLYEVNFNGAFHTEEATSMKNMFCDCGNLLEVDAYTLDTSNIEDMGQMFYGCFALKELDLSTFDTSNVKDMSYMFHECKKLETVDTSSFNTSKVRDMAHMFYSCNMLTTVYLNDWDFSNVHDYKNFMNEDVTVNGQPWEALFD